MLLDKVIYKKIEDGNYTLVPQSWEIKATNGEDPVEYVSLQCTIPELNNRPVNVALFEKGLDITASNIINHFSLEEQTLQNILDFIINKELPAIHETVQTEEGKVYYNWYICREERD